jgi:UDP:flavonoid glycosyltransferase YjiC (YdhE family)
MRILVTAYPLLGHLNPVLPIAQAAARAGHDVVLATGPDQVGFAARRGLDTWAVGPTHAESAATPGPWFLTSAGPRSDDLVPRTLDWRPDLVVADEFDAAGPVAAAACGAHSVVHGLGLMIPAELWAMLRVEEALADLHERWRTPDDARDVRAVTYLEPCPPSLRPAGERTWTRTRPVRPVPGSPAPDERLPAALDALPHPRTVHLTLGTLFHRTEGVLETALAGLRHLDGVNVVVTTGPDVDPARFGPQPEHVLLAPYLPHALLLPRCDLVVSQGGAGILLGALAHGLPQVLLPQGADQFLNAEAVERVGAGTALSGPDQTADAIRTAAGRLLGDPSATVAAAGVAAEITAMPSAGTVLDDLLSPA